MGRCSLQRARALFPSTLLLSERLIYWHLSKTKSRFHFSPKSHLCNIMVRFRQSGFQPVSDSQLRRHMSREPFSLPWCDP